MSSIRRARADEAGLISELALRSKAHWKYSPEQMAVFRDELTIAASEVVSNRTHVIEDAGRVVGFYTLAENAGGELELEHLFIEPAHLSHGFGTALFAHACNLAREAGCDSLVIQSDPNAAGFYQTVGAKLEQQIPSSIPGRTIPFFRFVL